MFPSLHLPPLGTRPAQLLNGLRSAPLKTSRKTGQIQEQIRNQAETETDALRRAANEEKAARNTRPSARQKAN
jgi:hypothetical protein